MKKILSLHFWFPLLAAMLFTACSDENDSTPADPSIRLDVLSLPVFESSGSSFTMTFTSVTDWTASTDQEWCSVSPASGKGGNCSITVTVADNETPDERNATLILRSGNVEERLMVVQKQQDALTVTSQRIEVDAEGGDVTVEVKANITFEYSIDPSAAEWLTAAASPRSLTTTQLHFHVAANDEVGKREGKITFSNGELSETVTIYQDGTTPQLVLSQSEYAVSSKGETIAIELRSNVPYEMRLPAGVDWLSEAAGRSVSTYTRRIQVAPNETYDYRSAQIVFINEEYSVADTVTITQVQQDAILVAQPEYTVSYKGGILNFAVNTNVDFETTISADWIHQASDTRALQGVPLSFVIDANTGTETREATITFTAGSLEQTVIVRQGFEQEKSILRIVHTSSLFAAPILTGTDFTEGRIMWGDGQEEAYSSESMHTYREEGVHEVTIESQGAETVTLENLTGITDIDLTQF